MRTKKLFDAPPPVMVATTPPLEPVPDESNPLVIALPENPTNKRTLDLTPWLNRGIDAWVHACAAQLRAFLQGKSVTVTTVANYWFNGMRYFLEYLVANHGPAEPAQLKPQDIHRFLGWLSQRGRSFGTPKKRYDVTKAVLTALIRRKLIPAQDSLFPANPFPGSHTRTKGEVSLSSAERVRLATALRDDLVAIHKGQFDGANSHVLVVHLLAIAIRCGANPTPLLEARRDCLQDHPFMPSMKRLILFKRRGNATKILQLRYRKEANDSVSVALDGVALVKKALVYSEPLLHEAKPEHRNRLWLCRGAGRSSGQVVPLTTSTLGLGIRALIVRHDLRGDDGEPLRLNLSRLRKTVEMRLFDLSGGDLIATAALMGHDPKVAGTHYLACTQQMRENATFVGEALLGIYLARSDERKVTPILPDETPAGRCKDPYLGDKAPKDGTPCDEFFACFACTSYAITGSPDDLHRLWSFYFFLECEMQHAKTEGWRSEFRHTMLLIERFTAEKFDAEAVATARERGRTDPIRFWAAYTLSETGNG